MIECKLKNVKDIINMYGHDWSNLSIERLNLRNEDISNIILPNDYEFFQKIDGKSIVGTTLPDMDLSMYNFEDVEMGCTTLTKTSKLPEHSEFLQRLKNKSIIGCILPKMDMSKWNFKDVNLIGCKIHEDSILPRHKDFLKDVGSKDLFNINLPKMSLSNYTYSNANLYGIKFHSDSTINEKDILNIIDYINNNKNKKSYPKELPKDFYISKYFYSKLAEETRKHLIKSENFRKLTVEEIFISKYYIE